MCHRFLLKGLCPHPGPHQLCRSNRLLTGLPATHLHLHSQSKLSIVNQILLFLGLKPLNCPGGKSVSLSKRDLPFFHLSLEWAICIHSQERRRDAGKQEQGVQGYVCLRDIFCAACASVSLTFSQV